MRELDLQRAFLRARPLTEDFQDKTGTVEHFGVQHLLEIALLYRRKRVVDDDKLYLGVANDICELVELAGADQGCRPRIGDHDDFGVDRFQIDRKRKADRLVEPGPGRAAQPRARWIFVGARLPGEHWNDDNRASTRSRGFP